jgi:hypothetical protein
MFSVYSAILTLYTVSRFLGLAKEFFGLATQMTVEKQQLDYIETHTWKQFEDSVNGLKKVLANTEE